MKQSTTSTHWLRELLPYASGFILVVGIIRIQQFYSDFNINIVQFISLSEVVMLLMDVTRAPLFAMLLVLIAMAITEKIKRKHAWPSPVAGKKDSAVQQFITCSLLPLVVIVQFFQFRPLPYAFSFTCLLLSIIITGYFIYQWLLLRKRNAMTAAAFLTAAILYMMYISYRDIADVRYNKKFLGSSVTLSDGSTLLSDSTDYLIGKTANYIFIHHEKDNSTEAIATGDIKKIKLRVVPFSLFRGPDYRPVCQPGCVPVFP